MKNTSLYGVFLLFLGVAAFAYVNHITPTTLWEDLFSKKYAYNQTQSGIRLVSDVALPSEILAFYRIKGSFILSPHMILGEPGELNSYMSQALIQQQIVLVGYNKVTTTLVRVYDAPNGKWVGCQTDYGTGKQNEFISVEECGPLLNSPDSLLFSIEFPDEKKQTPLIALSESEIRIMPVKPSDIPGLTFLVLRSAFPDAEELIKAANKVVENTQNQKQPEPLDSNILV